MSTAKVEPNGGDPGTAGDLDDEIAALKERLRNVEERLHALEIREELWQQPDAAGDEPVEP